MYKAKVISMMMSKKGSVLVSLFRSNDKLCDNAVLVNPTGIDIKCGDFVTGQIIFNNNGLNTFVLIGKEN